MKEVSTAPASRIRTKQTGPREPLLSNHCDNAVIGGYERYAASVFDGTATYEIEDHPNARVLLKIDYPKFKLFLASILWRASISADSFFCKVKLDPSHEEELRIMMLNGKVNDPRRFACCMIYDPTIINYTTQMVLQPDTITDPSFVCCRFVMGGLFWFYFIPDCDVELVNKNLVLTPSGAMVIRKERKYGQEFIKRFMFDVANGLRTDV
ncbi:MAG: hypothetical protein AMXMBFR84_04660 [Candidatus Hydrogenedentota bacterium]